MFNKIISNKEESVQLDLLEITPINRGIGMGFRDTVAIIGAAGLMGSFTAKMLAKIGFDKIILHDVDEQRPKIDELKQSLEKTNKAINVKYLSCAESLAKAKVIILACPTNIMLELIGNLNKKDLKNKNIINLASVQSGILNMIHKKGIDSSFGVHFMFRADDKLIENNMFNKNVIMTYQGEAVPHALQDMKRILEENTKANISIMKGRDHDQAASVTQSLTHLLKLLKGFVMRRFQGNFDVGIDQLSAVDTPLSRIDNIILCRMLYGKDKDLLEQNGIAEEIKKNSEMYGGIQMGNPEVLQMLVFLKEGIEKYIDIIKKKDKKGFEKMFQYLFNYFGMYHSKWYMEDSKELFHILESLPDRSLRIRQEKEEIKVFYHKQIIPMLEKFGIFDESHLHKKSEAIHFNKDKVYIANKVYKMSHLLQQERYDALLENIKNFKKTVDKDNHVLTKDEKKDLQNLLAAFNNKLNSLNMLMKAGQT